MTKNPIPAQLWSRLVPGKVLGQGRVGGWGGVRVRPPHVAPGVKGATEGRVQKAGSHSLPPWHLLRRGRQATNQCWRLKSSMPFERDLALQIIYLSKQPFKMQPQIENEDDATWSPQYNQPTTRPNEHRALLLQDVELDGWFLILHIVLLETYII